MDFAPAVVISQPATHEVIAGVEEFTGWSPPPNISTGALLDQLLTHAEGFKPHGAENPPTPELTALAHAIIFTHPTYQESRKVNAWTILGPVAWAASVLQAHILWTPTHSG